MNLFVDRLTLRLTGLSESDSYLLSRLIGERLATATRPARATTVDAMHVTIEAQPGEALESTARRIVEGMLRTLASTL